MANGKEGARTGAYGSEFRQQFLWQKAQEFAAELLTCCRDLPKDREADSIARQLIRSGTSIAANVAEGYGRYSQAAYRNHLSIARGSAFETESWLDLLMRQGHLSPEVGRHLIERCTEVQKLLTARMKTLSQGKTYAVKEESVTYDAD